MNSSAIFCALSKLQDVPVLPRICTELKYFALISWKAGPGLAMELRNHYESKKNRIIPDTHGPYLLSTTHKGKAHRNQTVFHAKRTHSVNATFSIFLSTRATSSHHL